MPTRFFVLTSRALPFGLIAAIVALVLATAWLADDAMITLRAVLNFTNGYGPNWNIGERVQVFTHPLWFLLLSANYYLTGSLIYGTFALSLGLTVATLLLIRRQASQSVAMTGGILTALLCSKAFIEYATSGLENSLATALLCGLWCWLHQPASDQLGNHRRHLTIASLICALIMLNRLDHGLLVLPLLLYCAYRQGSASQLLRSGMLGFSPLIIWSLFSTLYYGTPFPNTAYAKLNAGVDGSAFVPQGLAYLADSIQRDPVTLVVIVAALLVACFRGSGASKALALGAALYLGYVVKIGGDFMSGRFLMVPLVAGVLILGQQPLGRKAALVLATALVGLSLLATRPILLIDSAFSEKTIGDNHIADERGFYFQQFGLFSDASVLPKMEQHFREIPWQASAPMMLKTVYASGFAGLREGPSYHLVDRLALSDALLSRLPQGFGDQWEPGHFQRKLPVGYLPSLASGQNRIGNPQIAELYEHVKRMVRDPLWSKQRFYSIWYLNSGAYRELSRGYERLAADQVQIDDPRVYPMRMPRGWRPSG